MEELVFKFMVILINLVFKNFYLKFNLINLANTSTRGVYANGQASGVADSLIVENCQIGDHSMPAHIQLVLLVQVASLSYASKVHIINNDLYGTMRPVYFFYGGAAGTTSEISGNIFQSPYAPSSEMLYGESCLTLSVVH